MTKRAGWQVARIAALVGLLLLADPVLSQRVEVLSGGPGGGGAWAAVALVGLPVVFVGLAVAGRGGRRPGWGLALEALIAALLGVILPGCAVILAAVEVAGWPPAVVRPLVDALSLPAAVDSLAGLAQAANWYVLVLALAWLVIVVESAGRQRRWDRDGSGGQPAREPGGAAEGWRRGLRVGRPLALVALLWLADPVRARWEEAFALVEAASMWWTWLLMSAVAVAVVAVAVVGRRRRHPRWLLAGEGVLAAVIGLVLAAPVLPAPMPGRDIAVVDEAMAALLETFGTGTTPYVGVLALVWLVVVVATAVSQTARSHSARADRPVEAGPAG